ncbi:UDP-glucose/GDP-mannose dehydrogenase family protein [Rahnella sp. C60]|uniref:UDP-glucose 6-dehydrogenase n=1 Tax=Rahnella perminowiae TaxID=2816244 RepID=A0ABS6L0S8_9GAMM|nr:MULTISPECIES: UDP-glucose/GDP-mannose dehydrogenase family protein [Rahnella]UJD89766.1 UDP-glucose/GDP-mannose dehydrogenase family protein [Rahnella aquatilis]MBU9812019.1 UDP-glucose/GDP-mannose dehydrogenase family protein [Rahnella perminowiae]MBU9817944.1 UDP-glucose/GDP-mannose dehydrogenase family protein [Rahnella perminowiae]MBU9827643.1 UDP-glucose/GDP-mannose dehydrogenase family protein [Rahnella perminowiae]MBU9835447.1 UDP-glucose/GDP-mannose dehydrogenase family protein [Rah
MKVTVFGIGYVGLVQAAVLAEVGHEVLCIDVDAKKVENLKNGLIPIFEPGLTPLVQSNYEAGRLLFSTNAAEGVAHATVQFIAVGTPPDEDGSADLKYVTAVARTIAEHMTGPKVVIDKSTVPVGTADKVRAVMTEKLKERGVDISFDVVSNPEFLKEGAAVADCMRPERIVIGTDNPDAIDPIRELYEPFNRNHDRMILMDIRSAELTKYAANCMLATKISFMNEMSNLAEMLGADIEKVRQGIGSDSRIGYHFIYPGCGYGGSCFPKDVQALIRTAEHIGYQPKLLQAVEQVNYQQKYKLPAFIQRHFGDDLKGKTFALWGLSFKPNTDDMREASSRVLMEQLWAAGAKIKAYDPEAMNETQRIYGHRDDLELMGTKESALHNADALIICTEWQNFRAPDFDVIKKALKEPVIFDGRNLFDPERLEKRGFTYYGIGRGASINPVL